MEEGKLGQHGRGGGCGPGDKQGVVGTESISMAPEHLVKVGWLSVVYVEWVDGILLV